MAYAGSAGSHTQAPGPFCYIFVLYQLITAKYGCGMLCFHPRGVEIMTAL
jgi:hypothetical protein